MLVSGTLDILPLCTGRRLAVAEEVRSVTFLSLVQCFVQWAHVLLVITPLSNQWIVWYA